MVWVSGGTGASTSSCSCHIRRGCRGSALGNRIDGLPPWQKSESKVVMVVASLSDTMFLALKGWIVSDLMPSQKICVLEVLR